MLVDIHTQTFVILAPQPDSPYLPSWGTNRTLEAWRTGGYVYLMVSKGKRLYCGVASGLQVRVEQHKKKVHPRSHTARFNIDRLVYYEVSETITEAIARESQIKNLHQLGKIQLIVSLNPEWKDLSAAWGKPDEPFDESKMRPPSDF